MKRALPSVALTGFLLLATAGRIQSQAETNAPPHRRHHAIAYDPATRRVMVYGGQHLAGESDAPTLDDLWSWDGRTWVRIVTPPGAGNLAHRLFADGAGGLFVTGGSPGRTTRWDGHNWIVLTQDSTSWREMACGAYDGDRRRYVLFGGHIGGRSFPTDTWEFDGAHWSRVATGGLSPMLGCGMAWDAKRHVTVLFGGLEPSGRKLGDTWEWDGTRWSRVATGGPSPRFGFGMAYDAARGETILFGGMDSLNTKLDDTWLWNGRSWRKAESPASPPARSEGYLAFDTSRGVTVLFGGEGAQTIPSLGDTWEWDGTRWRRAPD